MCHLMQEADAGRPHATRPVGAAGWTGHPGAVGGRPCGMKRLGTRFHREAGLSCLTESSLSGKQDPALRGEQGPLGPFHKDSRVARGLPLQAHRGARNLGPSRPALPPKVKAAGDADLGFAMVYM